MSTERRGREVRNGGWRPLDRLGSLKIKLGVLIVVTVTVATVLAATGVSLGWLPGYTIPLAVISALLVTQVLARGLTSPIRDMTAAARAMARGDYGRRVPARLAGRGRRAGSRVQHDGRPAGGGRAAAPRSGC